MGKNPLEVPLVWLVLQSVKSRFRFHLSRLAPVVSCILVLFLMGQFGFVYYVGKNVTHYLKENMRMTVIVKEGADSSGIKEVRELIRSAPQVKEWRYVSKEEAADSYTEELGEDFRSVLGYNPLPATFEVYLKSDFANEAEMEALKVRFKQAQATSDVDYQQALVEEINANLSALFPIAAGLALVLLFITVTLIFNTTHLNLYAKRLELKSQQLVGATEWYIIKPFLKQALGQGLISGVVSALLLFNLGYLLLYFYPSSEMLLQDFDRSINLSLLAFMVVGLSLLGCVITAGSTFLALKRYLKQTVDELH